MSRSNDWGPHGWGVLRQVKSTIYRVRNIDKCSGCEYRDSVTQEPDGSYWCKASGTWRENNCKDIAGN